MRWRCYCWLLALLVAPFAAGEEPGDVVVSGQTRAITTRLQEARKRLLDRKTGEAIALLQGLVESGGNDLVPLEEGRSLQARWLAQTILAGLAPADRAEYRKRLATARRWLEQSDQDESALHRIALQAFCSPEALIALDRLGDQAFLKGRFAEAELWWRHLAPLDSSELPTEALVHPDTSAALAVRARAKQLLARLARDDVQFPSLLEAFRREYGKEMGSLAQRQGSYADILTDLAQKNRPSLVESGDWLTFGGSPSRSRVAAGPERLPEVLARLCRGGPTWTFDLRQRQLQRRGPLASRASPLQVARQMAFFPVVVGRTALVCDGRFITAYDLITGSVSDWYDAGQEVGGLGDASENPPEDIRYSLTIAEECLFARLGVQSVRDVRVQPVRKGRIRPEQDPNESILVSLSLTPGPDGERRRWLVRAIDPARKEFAVFEGCPVVQDGRVFVAATRFEGDRVITALHCYPAHPEDSSPAPLWRTDVCETRELLPASSSESPSRKKRYRHHLLTVAGDRLVYCSHSGVIAAVDPRTGQRCWALRYQRRDAVEPEDEPSLRDLAPCVFADGRIYVAPADSDRLYCMDPDTGSILWDRNRLDVVHLLGVGKGRLIFTTWRNPREGRLGAGGLRAISARDGTDAGGWVLPDDGGGLYPLGRPLLVGDLVLWPTARKPYGVFAVRQEDGRQPDNPALLHRVPSGNLLYANGCLLVATPARLFAYVPQEEEAVEQKKSSAPTVPAKREDKQSQKDRSQKARQAESRGDWKRAAAERLASLAEGARGTDEMVALAGLARVWEQLGYSQGADRLWNYLEDSEMPEVPRFVPLVRPLTLVAEHRLALGEHFLALSVPEGRLARVLLTSSNGVVLARDRTTGVGLWRCPVPFFPEWADSLGPLLIVAGKGGAALLDEDGRRLWAWQCRGDALQDFHLVGTRFIARQGDRVLLALGLFQGHCVWQRQAPGASFGMPAPRGRIHHLLPVQGRLLVQVSTRRWLLDSDTGALLREDAAPVTAWPRPPLPIGADRVCIVPDSGLIECLDARSGELLWSHPLPGRWVRSGVAPLLVPVWEGPLLVVDALNHGYRLQRLDPGTGTPAWSTPPLVQLQRFEASAWVSDGRTLWFADNNVLTAVDVTEGKILRQTTLSGPGVWHLQLAGADRLLAWAERGAAVHYRFRWLGYVADWVVGPLPKPAGWVVMLLEANTAKVLQRLSLQPERLPLQRRWSVESSCRLWPLFVWWRDAAGSAGPQVMRIAGGLLLALGNHAQVLAAQ